MKSSAVSYTRRLLSVAALALATPALAQDAPEVGLFESLRTLQVEIHAPWRDLTRNKSEKRWPATLNFTDDAGQPLRLVTHQHVTVADDADNFAGEKVDGPLTAYAQAEIIERYPIGAF